MGEPDFSWVELIKTVDAIDTTAVNAFAGNPGWLLIATGKGSHEQTTLTFAWPAPYPAAVEIPEETPQ